MVGLGNGDLVVRIDFIRHVVHVLGHAYGTAVLSQLSGGT